MREGYDVLGKYISLVDERNRELSITNLLGVSIEKRFIPSIANIVGTDLSSYKIVRTGQFAYGPVTSRNGEKISIALLSGEDCIISSSYTVFEIKDKNHLDAEYLMLWFSRPEFDRYARYRSHGSVREIFDWEEMCSVELPVPGISEQKEIVKAYRAITDRIELKRKINDNLEAQACAIFKSFFVTHERFGFSKPSSISSKQISSLPIEVTDYVANGSFASLRDNVTLYDDPNYAVYVRNTDLKANSYPKYVDKASYEFLSKSSLMGGEVIISNVADVGSVYLCPYLKEPMTLGSNVIMLKSENNQWSCFMYLYFRFFKGKDQLVEITTGSAQPKFNKTSFRSLSVEVPNLQLLIEFNELVAPIYKQIDLILSEIRYLQKLSNSYLTTLSRR